MLCKSTGWNYGSREAAEYSWMSGRMSAHGRAGWRRAFSMFMPLNQILMRCPYYGQIFRTTLPCMISALGTVNDLNVHSICKLGTHVQLLQEEGINTGPKAGTVDLRCCAIDSLGISQAVDFLKCDTEGAEIECLLGAEQLILRDRPWLLVENHSSGNFISLVRILANWDYLFTIIRHPDYEPFSRIWFEHCWFSCQPLP